MGIFERLLGGHGTHGGQRGGHHGDRSGHGGHGHGAGQDYHDGRGNTGGVPASAPRVTCPSCQLSNASNARFCQSCGTSLVPSSCKQCGTSLQAGAKFCSQCGSSAS
ncbi:zinc-ribbon domain-containing protein [Achromobacter aloeverae]